MNILAEGKIMDTYEPYWPKNILIVGAGASKQLGLAGTDDIGKGISYFVREDLPLTERIKCSFNIDDDELINDLTNLFLFLGDEGDKVNLEAGTRLGIWEKRQHELLEIYDWPSLKRLLNRCKVQDGVVETQDLLNLIDVSLASNQGVYVGDYFIRPERMRAARNMLLLYTTMSHKISYDQSVKKYPHIYEQFFKFALILGEMMEKEGQELMGQSYEPFDRKFYLFSYAVISMNWDPLFLWFVFNAHKKLNDRKDGPFIGNPPVRMKLFNDMAYFMAVRSVDRNNPEAWYPINETAVQRLNDPTYQTGRRVRIGKFYFPHGSHGFRECPNCGKLTFYLGNKWTLKSKDLFPPSIISSLAYVDKARSKEEEEAYKEGRFDVVQCSHCGSLTEAHHTAIILQTNYKRQFPSFIEEIHRDMKVAIAKAEHLIFFGYSLPSDDVQFRNVLSAKRNTDKLVRCSIVNYIDGAPKEWLRGKKLKEYISQYHGTSAARVCEQAFHLFGLENVRAYLAGIPQVFLEGDEVSRQKVEQLFNWETSNLC